MHRLFRLNSQPSRGRRPGPARWTPWEIGLIVLSLLLIAFPLYAEVYQWVYPRIAPAAPLEQRVTQTSPPGTGQPAPTNTPQPTNTPGGPTNTPQPTNTPVGPTNTPQPTNTPVASTNTSQHTNTNEPPTTAYQVTNTHSAAITTQ